MIEHGIVEASSYTPSRVLSPTLHAVGDFVEVCYHGEKAETESSSPNVQTRPAAASLCAVSAESSKPNGLTTSSDSWKNVEDLLVASSQTKSDALTFIPCESGSVVSDVSDIVLGDKSPPLSSGDATAWYGDESPGVHSTTHSKAAVTLSSTVITPEMAPSSKAEVVVSNSSVTAGSDVVTASAQSTTACTGTMNDFM